MVGDFMRTLVIWRWGVDARVQVGEEICLYGSVVRAWWENTDLQPAEVLPVVHKVLPDLQGYIDVIIAHNYSQIADTNYKYNHSVAPI